MFNIVFLVLWSCNSADNTKPPIEVDGLDLFSIETNVDESLEFWVNAILEPKEGLIWSGENLLDEPYSGQLRSPVGVLAGYMGNDFDRCRLVRAILSIQNIPSRYAISGDDCSIEAWVDDEIRRVPTSVSDDQVIDSWPRNNVLPTIGIHRLSVSEKVQDETGNSTTHTILTGPVWQLEEFSIGMKYDEFGQKLMVRTGDIEIEGMDIQSAIRHSLLFEYIDSEGNIELRERILFDRNSIVANQSPEAEDSYGIWIGSYIVDEPVIDLFRIKLQLGEEGIRTDALVLRAIELALHTDYAALQVLESTENEDAFHFTSPRILIAAQERRVEGRSVQSSSFDLLRNRRSLFNGEEGLELSFAISDALTEDAVIERVVGHPGLSTMSVFSSIFAEEATSIQSREELLEEALSRLEDEGITEETLVFRDPESEYTIKVVKVGVDLLMQIDEAEQQLLANSMGEIFEEFTQLDDGIILEGEHRSWPISLLFLEEGSALDHRINIHHAVSPQIALTAAAGSHIRIEGELDGVPLVGSAISRSFDEGSDHLDWHIYKNGVIISDGISSFDTPSLAESPSNTRILQFGTDPTTTSVYENPMWLHPAHALQLRNQVETEIRISYDTGTASDWSAVDFTVYEEGRMAITIDGQPIGLLTVTASSADGQYAMTIARYGETRMVLSLESPTGSWEVVEIHTPLYLRLQGRVVKHKVSPLSEEVSYDVGIPTASIIDGAEIGRAWPDGSFDISVDRIDPQTLDGSIGILIDSSNSMLQPADASCIENCSSRLEVVQAALESVLENLEIGSEMAIWSLEDDFSGECATELTEIHSWSLSRSDVVDRLDNIYSTWGTPLTGGVQAALSELDNGFGAQKRLIVLSDGENMCDSDLSTIGLPTDVEIYTIGIGIEQGSAIETELSDLASTTGGTYQWTENAEDLELALLTVGTLPIPAAAPQEYPIIVTAEGFEDQSIQCPVDDSSTLIVLEPSAEHSEPEFISLMPGDSWPAEFVLDTETKLMIQAHRSLNPDLFIVMPNQETSVGGWSQAFAWLEVDLVTLETTTLTYDGLHGASVVYLGSSILGLWSGLDGVMGSFSDCILTDAGCGGDIDEIRDTVCDTSGPSHIVAVASLAILDNHFTNISGLGLSQSYSTGVRSVEALCRGEFNSSGYVIDTGNNLISEGLGGVGGALYSIIGSLL